MGGRDGGRGGSLKTGVEEGIWGGGEGGVGEGIGILLVGCRGEGTCHLSLVLSLVLSLFFLSGSCFTTAQ